jgi:hypothetical protein
VTGDALVAGLDDGVGAGFAVADTTKVVGTCFVQPNGVQVGEVHDFVLRDPGERDVFSMIAVTPTAASAGVNAVTMRCFEIDGDADWRNVQVTAVALSAD